MDVSEQRRAYGAWLALCFLWGTGFVPIHVGVRAMPPLLFAGLRIFCAGVVVALWCALRGVPFPRRSEMAAWWVSGALMEGITNGVVAWAALWIPTGLLSLLIAMTPFWLTGLDAALPTGERLSFRQIAGLLVGFLGLCGLVAPQVTNIGYRPQFVIACLLMQGVCACIAVGSLYTRRIRLSASPMMGAAMQMLSAGLGLILAGTFFGEWSQWHWDRSAAGAFLYLMVFGSIIGYSCYIYALPRMPIAIFSLHRYANPAVAIFLGWALLHESFTLRDAGFVGVIALGILLTQRASRKAAPLLPE